MRSTMTLAVLAASCVAASAFAQSAAQSTAPTPQDEQRRAAAVAAPLSPLVSKTAEETTEAQLCIAERPDTAERIATFKKNLYDALRRKGFTAEQALTLTASTSIAPFAGR